VGLASFQMGNDWNIQLADGAKGVMESYGWEVLHTNAEFNTDNQTMALEGFLSRKVDGVIIGGGMAPALAPVIHDLAEAGIKVVAIDITSPECVSNIFPDNYMTTELLGVYSINKMNARGGKAVHLSIPGSGWHTVEIRDQLADLIFDLEGVEVTMLDSGAADAVSKSMTAVRSALLSTPDLDMVYCSWGMPAIGATRAIREAGKQDDVFVVCTDADRVVLEEMAKEDSPIAAVIGQQPFIMGEMAAGTLMRAFNGETDIPKIQFAPFVFVTKDPNLVPPGPTVVTPEEAWSIIYPDVPMGGE